MKNLKYFTILCAITLTMGSCILDPVDQSLEGEWSCTETSEIFLKSNSDLKGTSTFPVYIAQDATNSNKYYIDNFYQLGSGNQVEIVVSFGNTITISTQTINGIEFSGSGTINSAYDLVSLTYTADDGGGEVDHVTAEYSR
jgi:hypothetical protein